MALLAQKQQYDSLNEILLPVQKEMGELDSVLYELLDSKVPFVKTMAEYILKNGGKRLRPMLTIICAKMAGFQGVEAAKLGASVEFIHTASLLHDDVIDDAKIRRGKVAANAKWGNHISVLVGDYFYARASELIIEQGNARIMKVLAKCSITTTEGEVLEILKSSDIKTSKEDYLKIINNKTADLFAAACQVGGLLGGVSESFENSFKVYGQSLGMAFQLIDDILDYNSREDVFGKSNGVDLKEGKLTLPLILALNRALGNEKQIIKDVIMADSIDQESFLKVRDLIKKYHGFDDTWQLALEYVQKAKEALGVFRSSIEKNMLLTLADFVIHRER